MIGIFIIAALAFLIICVNVINNGLVTLFDREIYQALQSIRTPALDNIMIALTEIGDTIVIMSTTIALLLFLLVNRAWRTATFWTAAIVGMAFLNIGIKATVQRTRPIEDLYTGWSNFSFPSGHSSINFAMYASVAIILIRQLKPRWRLPCTTMLLSMAFLIAFSRMYLGAHWASDVVGAISLATTWLALLYLFYFRKRAEPINATAFIQIMFVALLLTGALNISLQHAEDVENYKEISLIREPN